MDFAVSNEFTMQNLNSVTDYSIDEHLFLNAQSNNTNFARLPFLRHEKPVILFTATGKKVPAAVAFSEDYESLQIFFKGNKKLINSREIKEISQSFIIQVEREDDNLFPVRVKTKNKQYLIAFFSKDLRAEWCDSLDGLLKCIVAYQSENVLKTFCEYMVRNQELSGRISGFTENQVSHKEKIKSLNQNIRKIEKSTIKHLLNDIITQVESKLHRKKIKEMNFQIANLKSEKILLLKNQKILLKSLQKKEEESELLNDTLESYKGEIGKVSKAGKEKRLGRSFWMRIFPYADLVDLVILLSVSKRLLRIVVSYLSFKTSWEKFSLSSLSPRHVSWPYFFALFYRELFPVPFYDLSKSQCFRKYPGLLSSICTLSYEVQEICLLICEEFKFVNCYEELGKVVNYVFFVVKDKIKVFEVIYSLSNPPYYLLEIWKPGLLRLRLGIFQVQKLLKLRHPYLHRHFKQIDISLDYIITPWIGTLFACYFSPSEKNETLNKIWDLFIIKGWNGLLTCCLALLHNSQDKVIGESLENTLKYYKQRIESRDVLEVLAKYSIEPGFLNELELSFYFYIEN